MILQFEGVCSIEGLHRILLSCCELHLVRPIIWDILLYLCNTLASSPFRACTGCCSCCLGLCGYTLRHSRLRSMWCCSSRIYLLPWPTSLEFWTHTNWSRCSLLCCCEIWTLESVCIVPCMRSVVWIWSSRASPTPVKSLVCKLDLVLLWVGGRHFLYYWTTSFQFVRIVSHQIRDYWSLWTRNCTTQWWNGSSVKISTALWALCICSRLREISSWCHAIVLYARWILSCLFGSMRINLGLEAWTVILQRTKKMVLFSNWMLDGLSFNCRCFSFWIWILTLVTVLLLFDCFLRFLNAVLLRSCQWMALVEGLVQSCFSTISFGCLRRVKMRLNMNTKLHVLEICDLLQILRRLFYLVRWRKHLYWSTWELTNDSLMLLVVGWCNLRRLDWILLVLLIANTMWIL